MGDPFSLTRSIDFFTVKFFSNIELIILDVCELNYKYDHFCRAELHNLSGYDSHLYDCLCFIIYPDMIVTHMIVTLHVSMQRSVVVSS